MFNLDNKASSNDRMMGHVVAGLVASLLLPLFHFQLFFFLLQSMGGNGFIACVAWAVAPSLLTRCGILYGNVLYTAFCW